MEKILKIKIDFFPFQIGKRKNKKQIFFVQKFLINLLL